MNTYERIGEKVYQEFISTSLNEKSNEIKELDRD